MIFANMAITPLFMKVPFSELMKIMLPAIIPFNLIKASVNGTIGAILYIPLHKSVSRYLDKQVVTEADLALLPPVYQDSVNNTTQNSSDSNNVLNSSQNNTNLKNTNLDSKSNDDNLIK